MDLIKFGVDVVSGLIGGTTNVVGLVVGSALGAMGVASEVANLGTDMANSIIAPNTAGQAGYVATKSILGGIGFMMTVYVATKSILWALFKFCPEKFLLHWLDWLAFRIARKARNEVVKRVKEKDAQLYIKAFAERALDTVGKAIKKGIE